MVFDLCQQTKRRTIRAISLQRNAGVDYSPWIDSPFFVELELSGVNMREIEDVVDDLEQVLTALANEPGIFLLFRLKRPREAALQHIREAEDRIERGAQLVAYICEKLRFGQIGRLRRVFRVA